MRGNSNCACLHDFLHRDHFPLTRPPGWPCHDLFLGGDGAKTEPLPFPPFQPVLTPPQPASSHHPRLYSVHTTQSPPPPRTSEERNVLIPLGNMAVRAGRGKCKTPGKNVLFIHILPTEERERPDGVFKVYFQMPEWINRGHL